MVPMHSINPSWMASAKALLGNFSTKANWESPTALQRLKCRVAMPIFHPTSIELKWKEAKVSSHPKWKARKGFSVQKWKAQKEFFVQKWKARKGSSVQKWRGLRRTLRWKAAPLPQWRCTQALTVSTNWNHRTSTHLKAPTYLPLSVEAAKDEVASHLGVDGKDPTQTSPTPQATTSPPTQTSLTGAAASAYGTLAALAVPPAA